MAKGYPDFYGIPQFPGYYAAKRVILSATCSPGAWVTVNEQIGKGIMYLGVLESEDVDMLNAHSILLVVDGGSIADIAVEHAWKFGNVITPLMEWVCDRYDVESNRYRFFIGGNIPFSESVQIRFLSVLGNVTVSAHLVCSFVEA